MKNLTPLLISFILIFSCSKSDSSEAETEIKEELNIATITSTSITEITPDSAISGGNVSDDGGATISARGVCWSTSVNPTIADNHTTDGTGNGSFTSTVVDLEESTTYYVRAYATNEEGTAYGSQKEFTTLKQEYQQKIFEGDAILKNQDEVDQFAQQLYTEVTGSLEIRGVEEPFIDNVSQLKSIQTIGNDLSFYSLDVLENFNGLRNLETVGGELTIGANDGLQRIDGLSSLKYVESVRIEINYLLSSISFLDEISEIDKTISISYNYSLTSIDGFNNIDTIGEIFISENAHLTSINGFANLTSIDDALSIFRNESLDHINGFQSLESVGDFSIKENLTLQRLDGFNSLKFVNQNLFIDKNHGLQEITGFDNLESVYRGMQIWWNSELKKIESFDKLVSTGFEMKINFNEKLAVIEGFNSFQGAFNPDGSPGRISIIQNYLLEKLNGFNTMTNFSGEIYIVRNYELQDLDCFQMLESAGKIVLEDTRAIESLTNFGQLVNVTYLFINKNHDLKNLNGLTNLRDIDGLTMSDNEQLTDFCALQGLFDSGWNGNLTIVSNGYNPTYEDLVAGNCTP